MILAIYKPKGLTSNQLLTQIKKITGIKKVGHAGTLDPLARGVLVVAIGRESTKKIGEQVKKEKEYIAKIKLGKTSETDDEEGPKTKWPNKITPPTKEYVNKVALSFLGKTQQTPPLYSAVKIAGVESYKLARKGKTVKHKPREVELKEAEILRYDYPYLTIRLLTGPGFYVRSFARDLGQKLKTGAYIADLERTRVGNFTIEKCTPLLDLNQIQMFARNKGR